MATGFPALAGAAAGCQSPAMPRFVLALDQGTTSSRAIVFDRRGRARAIAQQEFPQLYPRPGWVEHDPAELWASTRRVALGALAEADLTSADLAAIGLTNQRETTLVWERRTGRPIAPCDRLAGSAHHRPLPSVESPRP
jgi:glycerol kinase